MMTSTERGEPGASVEISAVHPVLMARDVTASLAFYNRLGFTTEFEDEPGTPRYAVLRREAVELHLQWADASQWAHGGDRPVYRFPTPDVDVLYVGFVSAGVVTPASTGGGPYATPKNTPWGTREFHKWDPGRNSLQFYGPQR
jgi:catechol 2,3-dioxygenase-like lactoylglutathione lyase family enzyme